ncbi:unnamed protein product [Calypogeia fissa]
MGLRSNLDYSNVSGRPDCPLWRSEHCLQDPSPPSNTYITNFDPGLRGVAAVAHWWKLREEPGSITVWARGVESNLMSAQSVAAHEDDRLGLQQLSNGVVVVWWWWCYRCRLWLLYYCRGRKLSQAAGNGVLCSFRFALQQQDDTGIIYHYAPTTAHDGD